MESHNYNVNLNWHTDRQGIVCSPELMQHNVGTNTCIEVATPPEFPKGIPGIWSPEHLFTAAVSSCLMTTFLAIAENSRLPFSAFSCAAKGKLERIDGKFSMTEILLEPIVTIGNEHDRERALKVLEKSEAACLITHSIRSTVIMKPTVHVEVPPAV